MHDASENSLREERRRNMRNRIVVLKKGVEKQQIIEGLCCRGGYIPYLWG